MILRLYRIVREKYADRLVASGFANRWNKHNEWVIYTGSTRSLVSLELLAHRSAIKPHHYKYIMLVISVDKVRSNQITSYKIDDLPTNWRTLDAYPALQNKGSTWYNACENLLMEVPSVLIPQESNYVINTRHPDFDSKVRLIEREEFFWDQRLL